MTNIDTRLATELKLLNILEEESLKILIRLQNNNQIDKVQFERAREIVKRIYYNEKDYMEKEPEDYYELYMDYYFKD